ncbi:MAG: toll/interleukin-1 receptor domain-containing protein [bacterium]
MSKVFISYSHVDRETAESLATRLREAGANVWLDRWQIGIGDSILEKINEGISTSDFLIVLLSKASVSSKWVKEELAEGSVMLAERGAFILPVLLEECEIPLFLRHRKYVSLKDNPREAFGEIVNRLEKHDALEKRDAAKMILDSLFVGWARKLNSAESEVERVDIRAAMEKQLSDSAQDLRLPKNLHRLWLDKCLEAQQYLELKDTIEAFKDVAIKTDDIKLGQDIVDWMAGIAFDLKPDQDQQKHKGT